MNEYIKNSIIRGAVVTAASLAVFFGIACFTLAPWYAIPFPACAIGYGVYQFVKRYYKNDD